MLEMLHRLRNFSAAYVYVVRGELAIERRFVCRATCLDIGIHLSAHIHAFTKRYSKS